MSEFLILFTLGGVSYSVIEILWRGYTHWTMFILGGICLYLLFILFLHIENAPLIFKAISGGIVITASEFLAGLLINLYLGWNVWNYSSVPYNILGQICLPYIFLWTLLSIPISFLCSFLAKYI